MLGSCPVVEGAWGTTGWWCPYHLRSVPAITHSQLWLSYPAVASHSPPPFRPSSEWTGGWWKGPGIIQSLHPAHGRS